jgi:hypothetical protein
MMVVDFSVRGSPPYECNLLNLLLCNHPRQAISHAIPDLRLVDPQVTYHHRKAKSSTPPLKNYSIFRTLHNHWLVSSHSRLHECAHVSHRLGPCAKWLAVSGQCDVLAQNNNTPLATSKKFRFTIALAVVRSAVIPRKIFPETIFGSRSLFSDPSTHGMNKPVGISASGSNEREPSLKSSGYF